MPVSVVLTAFALLLTVIALAPDKINPYPPITAPVSPPKSSKLAAKCKLPDS